MPRVSTIEDKTPYQLRREELGLSREQASELLEVISPERLERVESTKYIANPDEVMIMAEKYQAPHLCNYYCANECAIGQEYVPEIKIKHLSQIVLEMLSSLESVKKRQERLIEITADGSVEDDEIEDFVNIQDELERISITVEALQLWAERKIAEGDIDMEKYLSIKENKG